MKLNIEDIENHFKKWINYLFKDYQIESFIEVADNNVTWMRLAEIARFKTIAFEAEFFNKKNLENYVKMLVDIW